MRLRVALGAVALMLLAWPAFAWREEIHRIPTTDAAGHELRMVTRVCWPDAPGVHRVIVIYHGKSPTPAERANLGPALCNNEAVSWFLNRGYIAVMPVRRGYGETGGEMAEVPGQCDNRRDYAGSALAGAHDIAASVEYAARLPGAKPDGMVVLGQSAGGIATVAYDSLPHPRVAALISMAGGDGGHYGNTPGQNCRPDLLARAAAKLGASASTPMLWIYTENDSFFAPEIARSLRDAFVQAGGKLTFVNPGPYGKDGHLLFFGHGGSEIWGPHVEAYLARMFAGR